MTGRRIPTPVSHRIILPGLATCVGLAVIAGPAVAEPAADRRIAAIERRLAEQDRRLGEQEALLKEQQAELRELRAERDRLRTPPLRRTTWRRPMRRRRYRPTTQPW